MCRADPDQSDKIANKKQNKKSMQFQTFWTPFHPSQNVQYQNKNFCKIDGFAFSQMLKEMSCFISL